jgi:glycosidase
LKITDNRLKLFLVSALFLLFSANAFTKGQTAPDLPDEGEWWNNRVFYEIFVRSFYDSDGDGIGDFQGVIAKLDYLQNDLGINGIWLMPINDSPSYHGYDVSDYYNVNKDYGTLDDFKQLIDECHKRDIKIIMDLVMNHSSTEVSWFKENRDWYIWNDEKKPSTGPWGQNIWYPRNGEYYYSVFDRIMADLNYTNDDVTDEMHNIITFWLETGVDGFRLDALKYLIETDGQLENTEETHLWLKDFYNHYKSVNPDALTVGEVWDSMDNILPYSHNETDICFEFSLAEAMLSAVKTAQKGNLIAAWNKVLESYDRNDYATFLTNHDQNRLVSQLMNSRELAKNAAFLLLTSPGTPFIYYGEEIGMRGVKPDEDIRRPFHWFEDPRDGFTTGTPWRWQERNFPDSLEDQMADDSSLFHTYKNLIDLRKNYRALRTGEMKILQTSSPSVFAFIRDDNDQTVLALINLGRRDLEDVSVVLDDLYSNRKVKQLYWSTNTNRPSSSPKTISGEWIVYPRMEGFAASVFLLE